MSERRFAKFSIETLETLFDEKRGSLESLQSLGSELFRRKSKRACALLERVTQAIAVFKKGNETHTGI